MSTATMTKQDQLPPYPLRHGFSVAVGAGLVGIVCWTGLVPGLRYEMGWPLFWAGAAIWLVALLLYVPWAYSVAFMMTWREWRASRLAAGQGAPFLRFLGSLMRDAFRAARGVGGVSAQPPKVARRTRNNVRSGAPHRRSPARNVPLYKEPAATETRHLTPEEAIRGFEDPFAAIAPPAPRPSRTVVPAPSEAAEQDKAGGYGFGRTRSVSATEPVAVARPEPAVRPERATRPKTAARAEDVDATAIRITFSDLARRLSPELRERIIERSDEIKGTPRPVGPVKADCYAVLEDGDRFDLVTMRSVDD